MTTAPVPWAPRPDWQPGDPLYSPLGDTHSRYLFNFRDDIASPECHCGDAATWTDDPNKPLPPAARTLPAGDELGDLIAAHRRDVRQAWLARIEARA
jgi:hypothetical protein